jgi:alcohol dehydrogenase class IV
MRFEFATTTRIIFGAGTLRETAPLAAEMGRRALMVLGVPESRVPPLLYDLTLQGLTYIVFPVSQEPTVELVRRGTQFARTQGCDLVIACGGGSALDTGKAIAALVANPGETLDYLEVIGAGQPLTETPLPFIAIPTTAGTGSEVTRNAVLGSPEHKVKVSLRSPKMLPRLAVVDPELTYDLPPAVTASTGLDALTQLIEPFVSGRANPMTDAICREGMRRAAGSLRAAYASGNKAEAREDMALASLLGGLALANAGLGAVHGFAGPLGGMFSAPHGAVCARLLPFVMEANLTALKARQPEHEASRRYDEIGKILTGQARAKAADGVAWVKDLIVDLEIPPLGAYGITKTDFPDLIANAAKASSMKGNPVALTPKEMEKILEKAL